MKKILAVVLCALAVLAFAGCDAKAKCELCGEEKKCTPKTIFGEEVYVCYDCIDSMKW